MNRLISAAALLAFASLAAADGGWLTSYDAALKEAKKSGKPILVNFTGSDWCHWCIVLDDEVFSKPVFKAWAKQNVVLLQLDYPRRKPQPAAVVKSNRQIAGRYGVTAFPTILFLNQKGDVLGKYGYDSGGPTFWTKNADLILKSGKGRYGS